MEALLSKGKSGKVHMYLMRQGSQTIEVSIKAGNIS